MNIKTRQSKKKAFVVCECACVLCAVRGVCIRVTGRLNLLGDGVCEVCGRMRGKPKEIHLASQTAVEYSAAEKC